MTALAQRTETIVSSPDGVELATRQSGPADGPAVVLLHGITMTGDFVLMGSTDLQRRGFRVITYDARGHGRSTPPADPRAYGYAHLSADLLAVLDAHEVDRALLVGSSMGAHTALRLALDRPERVAGLAVLTPAFDPRKQLSARDLRKTDSLAEGIRRDGVEGFIDALRAVGDPVIEITFLGLTRRRLEQHRDLGAVADAITETVRDRPFESFGELSGIAAPAIVVGSRDRLDPHHPLELAGAYAAALGGAELVVEREGRVPLAWNGRRLGRRLVAFAERAHGL